MAERILHADGNGDFTIGSRGSPHKKNHAGLAAGMVFLMGAMEGVQRGICIKIQWGELVAKQSGMWQAFRT